MSAGSEVPTQHPCIPSPARSSSSPQITWYGTRIQELSAFNLVGLEIVLLQIDSHMRLYALRRAASGVEVTKLESRV